MGETGGTGSSETSGASLDRRRMLKTAAAAGVGVAAWSAPSITTLGFTPAYGATCSVASNVDEYDTSLSNVTCGSPCGDNIKLQGSVTFGPGDSFAAAPTTDGCADGVQTVSFTGTGTARCRIKTLDLYDNQDNPLTGFAPPPGSPDGTIPEVPQKIPNPGTPPPAEISLCSSQWGLTVECVPEGGCFPDEVEP